MEVETLLHGDNYIYLLIDGDEAVVVDPGAAPPVLEALDQHRASLKLILLTHYHGDHTGGCIPLKQASRCRVLGSAGGPIPLDEEVSESRTITFAGLSISVFSVPGHTSHDVAYYVPQAKLLFTGDTLFAGGCGRLFTNDPERLWSSLSRLRALPGDTRVYGGHDYARDNLEFAAALEPENTAIRQRLNGLIKRERMGPPHPPSTLAEECKTNPFLRCDSPEVRVAVNLPEGSAVAVFAELRRRKDHW
ncbi:MAG: hydroxyacylglutathione hydrolase [Verrucomicrobia bacterium]|jgi:hydroxyacylglutathione hydrolase|nr:hydroxyacylglutathione hydrolase [Verrucomicrobiota bacterium]